jgi:hypothetical protein
VNRSPNRIENWFMADLQSKAERTFLASTLRSASQSSLIAASSFGNETAGLDDLAQLHVQTFNDIRGVDNPPDLGRKRTPPCLTPWPPSSSRRKAEIRGVPEERIQSTSKFLKLAPWTRCRSWPSRGNCVSCSFVRPLRDLRRRIGDR